MKDAEPGVEQSRIISIDEEVVKSKLSEMVRGTVCYPAHELTRGRQFN